MQRETGHEEPGGWKAWLWMLICCVPMVAIVVLIALGFWVSSW